MILSLVTFQLKHSKMHPVTALLLAAPYPWHPKLPQSSLPPLSLPPPMYHPHNCSFTPSAVGPAKPVAPLTSHTLQTTPSGEHVRPRRRTSRRTELKENTKQCLSVSLSASTPTPKHQPEDPLVKDKSNESVCPLR